MAYIGRSDNIAKIVTLLCRKKRRTMELKIYNPEEVKEEGNYSNIGDALFE